MDIPVCLMLKIPQLLHLFHDKKIVPAAALMVLGKFRGIRLVETAGNKSRPAKEKRIGKSVIQNKTIKSEDGNHDTTQSCCMDVLVASHGIAVYPAAGHDDLPELKAVTADAVIAGGKPEIRARALKSQVKDGLDYKAFIPSTLLGNFLKDIFVTSMLLKINLIFGLLTGRSLDAENYCDFYNGYTIISERCRPDAG